MKYPNDYVYCLASQIASITFKHGNVKCFLRIKSNRY